MQCFESIPAAEPKRIGTVEVRSKAVPVSRQVFSCGQRTAKIMG